MDVEEADVRSRLKGARTARSSAWEATAVFSEGNCSEGGPQKTTYAASKRSGRTARQRTALRSGQSVKQVEGLLACRIIVTGLLLRCAECIGRSGLFPPLVFILCLGGTQHSIAWFCNLF